MSFGWKKMEKELKDKKALCRRAKLNFLEINPQE